MYQGTRNKMPIGTRTLTEIANTTGSDKGTSVGLAHGYTVIYEAFLGDAHNRPTTLMEIGLAMGGPEAGRPASRTVEDTPSVRMWHERFPKATVYGVDISDCSAFQTDWFHFFQADCGDASRLAEIQESLSQSGISFDVIIDDGSHASYHQQLTLLKFFPLLRRGGIYIIEDLNFVPLHIERELPAVPRTRDLLGQILRHGRVVFSGALSSQEWESLVLDMGSIMTFDDAYLADLRRLFNIRAKISENADVKRHQFSPLRRVARAMKSTFRAAVGEQLSPHHARTKLAIIHKSLACEPRRSEAVR
jgi:hypothetical protein